MADIVLEQRCAKTSVVSQRLENLLAGVVVAVV
jgi:hypothetical protein